jgi:hypothetical protein
MMKLNQQMKTMLPLAALAGLTVSANATIILTENFSGDGSNLVGTTTADGNDWTGNATEFNQDGTTSDKYSSVYLAIPGGIVQGPVYTLKTTLSLVTDNANEMFNFGFATAAGAGASYPDGSTGYASLGFNTNDGYLVWADQTVANNTWEVNGTWADSWVGDAGTIVLDTTNAADYTVTFHDGSGQVGGSYSLGGAPALTHIWIGQNRSGSYTFDQVMLSDNVVAAVPEPTTTALLGLGGLALILRRRK